MLLLSWGDWYLRLALSRPCGSTRRHERRRPSPWKSVCPPRSSLRPQPRGTSGKHARIQGSAASVPARNTATRARSSAEHPTPVLKETQRAAAAIGEQTGPSLGAEDAYVKTRFISNMLNLEDCSKVDVPVAARICETPELGAEGASVKTRFIF